jgi:hypothetical protein
MKKSYYCFFFYLYCLCLINIKLLAQCTGCTSNVAASNAAIAVNNGDVVCVTSGTTQSGNIVLNAGGVICFASGVTVTGSFTTNNMNSATSIIIQSGATISNSSGINFNGSTTGGTISNRGSWLLNNLTLPSQVTFNNSGNFGTNSSALSLTMNNNANFINTGQVFINNFNFNNGAAFTSNAGSVSIGGNPSLNGSMNINGGSIAFSGSVTVNSSAAIVTQPGTTFSIAGALSNNGTFTLASTAPTIGGSVTNNSSGTITVNNTTLSVGGSFSNNGPILAGLPCGRINVAGSSVQNSSGSVGANADICDLTSTPPSLFDSQAGTVNALATRCLCNPTLLPVTWAYVKAVRTNTQIEIHWGTTATENHQKFEIERSADAQRWELVGEEAGTNTDLLQHYLFTDHHPLPTAAYYRVKQLETNGYANYSKIVAVAGAEAAQALMVMPNPFQDELTWYIDTDVVLQGRVSVSVIGIDGRVFFEQQLPHAALQNFQKLSLPRLPEGNYLLKIVVPDRVWQKKIVKIK